MYILEVICSRKSSRRGSRPVQSAGYISTQGRRSVCLSVVFYTKIKQVVTARYILYVDEWRASRSLLSKTFL